MADIRDLIVRIRGDTTSFNKSVDDITSKSTGANNKLKQFSETTSKLGSTLTTHLTLPIIGAGAAIFKTSSDFQSSMEKIVGLVGVSQNQVDSWKNDILQMAQDTGRAPQELADGLFYVTSAGLRGKAALDVLDASAKAAAAGLGQTKDIANAVTGAINAYGPANLKASKAVDILTATARAGQFDVSQLAGALGQVTPFAQAAGVSFSDVGGSIALLTRRSGDANSAIAESAAMFRAFAAPTTQTIKQLQQMGLTTTQVRDSLAKNGLVATLEMLKNKLHGNMDALRNLIPDSQGMSAALQILNAKGSEVKDVFGQVAHSSGMTDEAFKKASHTSSFKFNQAMSQAKVTLISLGNSAMPAITSALKTISGWLKTVTDWFNSLSPAGQKTVVMLAAGLAVLGPLIKTMSLLTTVIRGVAAAMTFLGANPIILVILAVVAAIAAAAYLIIHNWNTLKKWFDEFWRWLKHIFSDAWNFISGVWDGAVGLFRRIVDGIKNVFGGIKNFIVGIFKSELNGLITIWDDTIGKIAHGQKIGVGPLHVTMPNFKIPKLAAGGIVDAPTLAMIGEGKSKEAVIPLDKLPDIIAKSAPQGASAAPNLHLEVHVGMYAGMPVEKRQIALDLYKELVRAARAQGVQLPMIGAVSPQ